VKREVSAVIVASALWSATAADAQSLDTTRATPSIQAATPQTDDDQDEERGGSAALITRLRHWVRDVQLLERMNGETNGWYPRIGGVTRGAGLAGGPGYRVPLFDNALLADLSVALSTKGYTAIDARLRMLQTPSRRMELWTEFRAENFPQEDFFGTGMATSPSTQTSYDFDNTDVRLRWIARPRPWARVTTLAGYRRPAISRGEDRNYPSIDDLFSDVTAPGLLAQPDFLHATVTGEIDYRDSGGNTTRGGFYRMSYGLWNDVTLNAYDFHRIGVEAMQFVPLTPGGTHVVSGRIGAAAVNSWGDGRVPFYFLAYVGGRDTVRSVAEYRYKDHDALWLSGEYKWSPKPFLSLSAFADIGQVSPDWHALRARDMQTAYGVGVGVHSATQTLLRVSVGTGGGEGWQCFVSLRPEF
jgi:hypothetical protein